MPRLLKSSDRWTNRIRVYKDLKGMWVWDLLTPDGHVVQQSEPFEDRATCENQAKEQGLPVRGLSRTTSG